MKQQQGLEKQDLTPRLISALLVLAVVLVFGQTLDFQFVNFDDDVGVYLNPLVRSGMTWEAIAAVFTERHVESWCPLTCLSHMVVWKIFGGWAGGHHLVNVILHAASTLLLFFVLRRMTACVWASAMVAACFAVHPLHVESVAWVTERKDALGGLFFMLTLVAYVRYVQHPFSLGRYLTIIGLFILGLLAKPIIITLPFLMLVLDYWPLNRMRIGNAESATSSVHQTTQPVGFSRLILEKVPLFLLVAISCGLTIWGQADFTTTYETYPLQWRLTNALINSTSYLGQTFWPVGLAICYPRRPMDLPMTPVLASLVVLVVVTIAVLLFWRRRPYLIVGWLWYLGTLVPVLGIVQFGNQSEADRFTYLSQIGVCIAVVWGVADLCRSWRGGRWVCGICGMLVLAVMTGWAWRQTSFWCDSETMWNRTLACTSNNSLAHNDLGTTLAEKKHYDEAVKHYHRALEIKPDYTKVHNNLGLVLAKTDRLDEAIKHYRLALDARPDYPEANNNLANALVYSHKLDEAIVHYRRSLDARPNYVKAMFGLAVALWQQGSCDEAIDVVENQLLKRQPNMREARRLLNDIRARRDKMRDAVAGQLGRLDSNPDNLVLLNEVAWILATNPNASIRDGGKAVELAERAVRLSGGQNPAVLDTLAAAQAEVGRFSDAVKTAQKAIDLASQQAKTTLADSLKTRIKLYQDQKPCRVPWR